MKYFQNILALIFGLSIAQPALACGLDDCRLPIQLHLTGVPDASKPEVDKDEWAWMNHELAVARDALATGRRAFALELAHGLFAALEAQGKPVAAQRGRQAVQDFFDSLQELVAQCGGRPLRPLQLAQRTTD